MKKIVSAIVSSVLIIAPMTSYAQPLNKLEKTGYCFATILVKKKNNLPTTAGMNEFIQKNNPTFQKIASLMSEKCKGLTGEARYYCVKDNLSPSEGDFYTGSATAFIFLNGPQDPTRLPNVEIASAQCEGLVKF